MCLGTFSRLARSLATVYIFARVRIFGTSVPFYVTGNSSEFPVTYKIAGQSVPALPRKGFQFYAVFLFGRTNKMQPTMMQIANIAPPTPTVIPIPDMVHIGTRPAKASFQHITAL